MNRGALIDAGALARMLNDRIGTLAPELLPDGQRQGHEWTARPPWRPDARLGTMSVHLSGLKAGVWKDFVQDIGGDGLDLVAHCRCGGDKKQAFAWARRWLGLDTGGSSGPALAPTPTRPPTPKADSDAEAEQRRDGARRIWLHASPNLMDTPVARYLAGRGIPLAELARPPRAIRYHQALHHAGSGRSWPAMVASIVHPDAPHGFAGCHRTWLSVGAAGVTKAPIERAKLTLGSYGGGHIPLARGASGRSLREAPDEEVVDITEGIEDGLTVAWANPAARVIAAISLSNLGGLLLPPQIHTIRIWRQNDTKLAPIAAFDRAVERHMAAGRRVLLVDTPPAFKDVNDWARAADDEESVA